ncbi:MAG: hypothetical protein DRI61_15375 [Chloroflexi bacterium]|nr:MAG: hypothetical protein DRI61_15375 [Chloroflexota bacterium]
MTTLKKMKAAAKEINEKILEEDSYINLKAKEDELKEMLVEVAKIVEPEDDLSDETKKVLEGVGAKLPKKPEPKKAKKEKKPEPKEEVDPLAFNPKFTRDMINKIICDNRDEFDEKLVHAELKKLKMHSTDANVRAWVKDMGKAFKYLKEIGAMK